MALTAQQEQRLAELERKYSGQSQARLTPEQESRLKELEAKYGIASEPEPQPQFAGEGYVRGALQALPAAGALAGGAVGTALGPAGLVGGGMLGAAGGRALQNIGESMLGDEKTRQDIYMGPVKEAATEGALMGAGGLVAKGGGLVGKYIKAPIENVLSRLSAPAKKGAQEITEAAARLGTKPTRGMLTDERFIQNLESSLMQTPSTAGQNLADQAVDVNKAMRGKAEEVFTPFRTPLSPNQLAQEARSSISSGVQKKLEPAITIYDQVAEKSPFINVSGKSLSRIAKNIENLPYAKISGTPEASLAQQINSNLAKTETLDELRNLKSYVGAMARDKNASPTMRNTAGEIADRLARLEQNSITKNVIETTRQGKISNDLGRKMVSDLKAANKIYSTTSKELVEIAEQAGLGKVRNHADFTRKLESLSDEALLQKMFKPSNQKLLVKVQKSFPEAFESMKKAQMMKLYEKSLTKGEVSIPKLLNNAKNLSPEAKQILFGPDSARALKDIETVYNAIPQRVGPSGTPEGIMYTAFNPFSPTSWFNELASQSKAKILENPQAFAKFKKQLPEVKAFEETTKAPLKTAKRRLMESTAVRTGVGLLPKSENDQGN